MDLLSWPLLFRYSPCGLLVLGSTGDWAIQLQVLAKFLQSQV